MIVDVTKNTPGRHNIFGDLITQKWARDALPIIIARAKDHKIIRYEELRSAIRATTNRKMGNVCGFVSTTLFELEDNQLKYQWESGHIPRLTNIVVRTNGKPGAWICEQITGDRSVAPSCDQYEEKYVDPVYDYKNWDTVLEVLLSESIEKALENLDEKRRQYYEFCPTHWTVERPSGKKRLQQRTIRALKDLTKAERKWTEAILAYCRYCRPDSWYPARLFG